MRILKCYIAQRGTGEIVPVRQVNIAESEDWRCHHCQCPLIFHLPTRTSPPWFEYDILQGLPEALLQCPYLAPSIASLQQWRSYSAFWHNSRRSLLLPGGNAPCAV